MTKVTPSSISSTAQAKLYVGVLSALMMTKLSTASGSKLSSPFIASVKLIVRVGFFMRITNGFSQFKTSASLSLSHVPSYLYATPCSFAFCFFASSSSSVQKQAKAFLSMRSFDASCLWNFKFSLWM